jgi:hypothetical protein
VKVNKRVKSVFAYHLHVPHGLSNPMRIVEMDLMLHQFVAILNVAENRRVMAVSLSARNVSN